MAIVMMGKVDKVLEGKAGVNGVNFSLSRSGTSGFVNCIGRVIVPDVDLTPGQKVTVEGSWVTTADGSCSHFQAVRIVVE